MENEKAVIGALGLILFVIVTNFVMYGVVRGAAKARDKGLLESLRKAMSASAQKKDDDMDELRKKVTELQKGGKEE
ncbi:MAG: hypothetical protein LDL51_09615 [Chloroflexi bacterium]|nr:hypothetical protein [Chloroflexota bacterium]